MNRRTLFRIGAGLLAAAGIPTIPAAAKGPHGGPTVADRKHDPTRIAKTWLDHRNDPFIVPLEVGPSYNTLASVVVPADTLLTPHALDLRTHGGTSIGDGPCHVTYQLVVDGTVAWQAGYDDGGETRVARIDVRWQSRDFDENAQSIFGTFWLHDGSLGDVQTGGIGGPGQSYLFESATGLDPHEEHTIELRVYADSAGGASWAFGGFVAADID